MTRVFILNQASYSFLLNILLLIFQIHSPVHVQKWKLWYMTYSYTEILKLDSFELVTPRKMGSISNMDTYLS